MSTLMIPFSGLSVKHSISKGVDCGSSASAFADGTERTKKQLSEQMRSYYDKHLDPEKSPSPEDLDILQATEEARKAFDRNLAIKFEPAIHELEGLGYPGIADPKLTIATKMSTSETLKHDAAVPERGDVLPVLQPKLNATAQSPNQNLALPV